jgi:hypothetical protein
MKTSGLATYHDIQTVLPERKSGLKSDLYFEKGAVTLLRSKKPSETATWAYMDMLMSGNDMPIGDLLHIGFKQQFLDDLKAFTFPEDRWTVPKADLYDFKRTCKYLNSGYGSMRISTIHGAKGMEADTVLLFLDIAHETYKNEQVDPDSERRVWYTAITRARNELIITKLNFNSKTTGLLWN